MTTYDKQKRKNTPTSPPSIPSILSSLVAGLLRYGVVIPIRWGWKQLRRLLGVVWNIIKGITNWFSHQVIAIIQGVWWLIHTILQKLVFSPFIAVGRLLGFVPNAIPEGLTGSETEIYQRVSRQYRRRKRWYLHVITFLISTSIVWISYFFYSPFYAGAGTAVLLTIVWLFVLASHRLWMNLGKSEDHEIGEALQHLRQTQHTNYHENTYQDRRSRLQDYEVQEHHGDDEDAIYQGEQHLNSINFDSKR